MDIIVVIILVFSGVFHPWVLLPLVSKVGISYARIRKEFAYKRHDADKNWIFHINATVFQNKTSQAKPFIFIFKFAKKMLGHYGCEELLALILVL